MYLIRLDIINKLVSEMDDLLILLEWVLRKPEDNSDIQFKVSDGSKCYKV